ncbi:PAP2 superfamily protein [endosymbiont of Acanthamoeba sp. UWC8]|uniref:NUDIX hydrolase n=1 Tax=endosymbiont of Acanthamoeba sp. UWC8 TaxID=86106 RepID=UPI0004D0DD55|nr:NUDIX domain-containing protein [endosymbiont of Acanthamoeba sp. UWC8]AIF81601.1 PAP2 superfamily protein [endosymbiont of Acanthamoeba sp. UWC8]
MQQEKTYLLPKIYGKAGCIIKKNGKLLAVKNANCHKWDIPSGRPEGEELAYQTAARETYEETGLKAEPIRLLKNSGDFYIFECKIISNEPPSPQVPKEFENEIEMAKFIEIDFLNKDNVRFPDALEDFKEVFSKVE